MDRDFFMSEYRATEIGCIPILYGNNCDFQTQSVLEK